MPWHLDGDTTHELTPGELDEFTDRFKRCPPIGGTTLYGAPEGG